MNGAKYFIHPEKLVGAKLLIDDGGNVNINELRSKCEKLELEHDLGLVIIDYLQLMSGRNRENRQQEISEISRGLKLLAKELNIPVVALSQLSRACEQGRIIINAIRPSRVRGHRARCRCSNVLI